MADGAPGAARSGRDHGGRTVLLRPQGAGLTVRFTRFATGPADTSLHA